MKRVYHLITFQNTTNAMLFERKAKAEQVKGRLIPLPKQISAGCGLAFSFEDQEACKALLEKYHIEYETICEVNF